MTDTPKFTVVDRRKFHADDESATTQATAPPAAEEAPKPAETPAAPRLTLVEPSSTPSTPSAPSAPTGLGPIPVEDLPVEDLDQHGLNGDDLNGDDLALDDLSMDSLAQDGITDDDFAAGSQLPPAPSAEESRFQKLAYEKAAERLDDLVRAQNPGAPAPEKIGFEHLVQQLYLSAMMQMGAGTPEGQRPRIDILGARQTIDLLAVVLDKSKGNLTVAEESAIQTVLYELRMTFLELTRMISAQPMPPPPGGLKR